MCATRTATEGVWCVAHGSMSLSSGRTIRECHDSIGSFSDLGPIKDDVFGKVIGDRRKGDPEMKGE